MYLFITHLFKDAINRSDYLKECGRKHVNQFEVPAILFFWRGCGKPQKCSVRIEEIIV
jgi:hypothetical protein